MDSEPVERLLGLNEAGRIMGCSYWTMREWALDGKVPYFRIGRKIMVQESDLRKLIDSSRSVSCLTK
jgi:excisionase family DNA binding protein